MHSPTAQTRKAFTLIELLVAVSIIALLVSSGIVVFIRARKQAQDNRRISDLRFIESALETYFEKYRHYPIPMAGSETQFNSSTGNAEWIEHNVTGETAQSFVPEFMRSVPIDPINTGTDYIYYYCLNSQEEASEFKLVAKLVLSSDETTRDGGTCDRHYEVFSSGGKSITCPCN